MRVLLLTLSSVLSSALFVSVAFACASCGFGNDPSRPAYLLTTGIMTAVPLIAIGVLIVFLMKYLKRIELEDTHENPPPGDDDSKA